MGTSGYYFRVCFKLRNYCASKFAGDTLSDIAKLSMDDQIDVTSPLILGLGNPWVDAECGDIGSEGVNRSESC